MRRFLACCLMLAGLLASTPSALAHRVHLFAYVSSGLGNGAAIESKAGKVGDRATIACSLCRYGRVFDSERLARAIFSCYAVAPLGIYGTAVDSEVGLVCIDSTVFYTLRIKHSTSSDNQ